MSEIEKLNIIAEWQEQHKQLIEDLNNSKKRIAELEAQNTITQCNRSALSGVKWHKVADGDLPKECTDVLAIDILAGKPSEPSLYHFVTSDTWEWLPKRIACLSNEQMLAWAEIPTFTK